MDKNLFLKMIDAAVKGNSLPETVLDNDFLLCAKEQTFLPMLYPVFHNAEYKKFYLQSCLVHERFDAVAKILSDVFASNGIRHIFLKGQVIKNYYKDSNLRMQGDIDILVDEKDYSLCEKLLLKEGFTPEEDTMCVHHKEFFYQGIMVELHRSLFDEGKYKEFDSFFQNYFSHAVIMNNYSYQFEKNFNFVYLIAHYASHLRQGAGLRELCDLYLILTQEELDEEYILSSLEKIGLREFYNTILNELDIIFGYKDKHYTKNEHTMELIDFSLKAGIHGNGHSNNYFANQIATQGEGSKFKFLLKKLFIPVKSLFVLYPWTKSIILIPLGYIVRFFFLIFKRRNKLKSALKNKNTKNDLFINVGL